MDRMFLASLAGVALIFGGCLAAEDPEPVDAPEGPSTADVRGCWYNQPSTSMRIDGCPVELGTWSFAAGGDEVVPVSINATGFRVTFTLGVTSGGNADFTLIAGEHQFEAGFAGAVGRDLNPTAWNHNVTEQALAVSYLTDLCEISSFRIIAQVSGAYEVLDVTLDAYDPGVDVHEFSNDPEDLPSCAAQWSATPVV